MCSTPQMCSTGLSGTPCPAATSFVSASVPCSLEVTECESLLVLAGGWVPKGRMLEGEWAPQSSGINRWRWACKSQGIRGHTKDTLQVYVRNLNPHVRGGRPVQVLDPNRVRKLLGV